METSSSVVLNQLFPTLGPALMISMGYIDLGKCFAAVEGGARFGHDLVLLVLIFNLTAIICQYLAVCVGMATGKDLAQICSEEYNRPACMMLGVEAEVSMFASDLTMIMGIAYGFTLLVGADLFVCTCFAIVGVIMLPFFVSLMDNKMAEALYTAIAGCALLFYVLGVLISQPEMPIAMNIFFPKLSGDSAYLLMALLGANVMAHNIYVHSSMVHHQKRLLNTSIGALFHDHFFAILFIFTGIFLVNYVLMNSAAVVFSNTDVALNFQDLSLLLDQILRNPIAPLAFFLVLLFSSQVTALTWSIGGKLILRHLFGATHSVLAHNFLVKSLSAISALCYAKSLDAEGIYQVLIFCQVIQAMLLPSSVIPLFRVASSRLIMGTFKISRFLEMLALLAFLGMFGSNVIFVIEMLFGNSSWIQDLKGILGTSTTVSYAALLVIASASMFFTLYLLVTPLKSASERPDTKLWNLPSENDQLKISKQAEDNMTLDKTENEVDCMSFMETTCDSLSEVHHDKPIMEFNVKHLDPDVDSDQDFHQSNHDLEAINTVTNAVDYPDAPKSVSELDLLTTEEGSSANLSEPAISEKHESEDCISQEMTVEPEACTDFEETVKLDESFKRALPLSKSEDSGSIKIVKEKSFDADNGSGSISKLFGLGRAARRQLAAILDEFWGHLFDFHGKLTQEASDKQLDIILGLNQRAPSSVKLDEGIQFHKNAIAYTNRGHALPNATRQSMSISDSSYGVQMGSPSWSSGMPASNINSSNSLFASTETLNSNLNLLKHSDNRDYQPATIHGYQIASYLKTIGAGRSPYSSNILRDPPAVSKPAAPFSPNFRDSVLYANGQNGFNSLGISSLQNPVASQINRLQAEGLNYDPSFIGPGDNITSSAYTKKYHSSPDISAIIAAGRQAYMNEAKCGGPIGPRSPSISNASKRSQYMNSISVNGVPYEFSPPTFHRDVLSVQSNLNSDTGSLWSKQPFEQLFGVTSRIQAGQAQIGTENLKHAFQETSCGGSESELLQSLYDCILKLLKLEGSDWLFKQNGGCDEDLIERLAATEKCSLEADASEMSQLYSGDLQYLSSGEKVTSFHRSDASSHSYHLKFPNCGDNCTWKASLVVSFGVWCVRRILELSLVESRPELWGKYTYVLNRLQGVLELAFLKPRRPLTACSCLDVPQNDTKSFNSALQSPSCKQSKPIKGSFTTATTILETIKNVEIAISGRKGRTGTAAGDIAFPKGKENLASVLKRYKRRLSNKPTGTPENIPSRNIPATTVIV